MKNQKGITLIALVVTIIVLLILAGVSIAMLTGDNGILTNASKSSYETEKAEAIEKINMELNSIKTTVLAKVVDNSTYDAATSNATLVSAVINELGTDKAGASGKPYLVSYDSTNKALVIKYTTDTYTDSSKQYSSVTNASTKGCYIEGTIKLEDNDLSITGATEKVNP